MRPTDPITLTLTNGEEREFLLTMGGIRRLKARFKVKQLSDIFQLDAEASGVPILFEAMLNRGEMTEEQFADLLPAHLQQIIESVAKLLGASMPDANPPTPTPVQ